MNDVAFVTIIARNYAAYALALIESIAVKHEAAWLYVVVVDTIDRSAFIDFAAFTKARILLPIDFLPYESAMNLAYSYDVTELSTALKPFVLRYLLNAGHRRVIYLDPDILVLQSFATDVLSPLDTASIVLTPHTTEPIPLDGRIPSEVSLLVAGAYNLGFIGVRDCEESRRFLSWWADRLERLCLNDVARGLFVDQKWIDLVPSLFPQTRILRHRGLNVAYWNLHSRHIVFSETGPVLHTGEPLIFFHFSGFDPRNPASLSRHQDRIDVATAPVLAALLEEYSRTIALLGHEHRSQQPYGYATLSDGTRVDRFVRSLCREARERGLIFPDPHDVDAEPSLLDYCNASDSSEPDRLPRLTRYLARVHASRPDLKAAFPDPRNADRDAYLAWVSNDVHNGLDRAFIDAATKPQSERSRGGPIVNVAGYFSSESGVGEAGRAHIAAVRSAGCSVHLVDFTAGAAFSRARERVADGVSNLGQINLVCVNADQLLGFAEMAGDGFFRSRYTIGSWYWELPTFPREWFDRFALLNEIWVGSEYVRTAISASAPIPVFCVPPIIAPPSIRDSSKARFAFPAGAFVFIFFFDYLSVFERKNPLGAVDAFRRAFVGRNDVRLVIKTINARYDRENANYLIQQCASDPRIEIRETYLSRDEKNAMIAAADCYVSLHRAEGFGLTIAEAMYFGTPVICTDWSGNTDFANASNAHVVSASLVPLGQDFGPYTAGQFWAEPDLDQAADAMRRVVDDPIDACARANRARENIRKHFSADAVGAIVSRRLERIFGDIEVQRL